VKNIIITGASGGIGLATAQEFLNAGWTVGLMARRREKLEEIAHANAIALPGDVTKPEDVDRCFNDFVAKTGHLDALFNNAGISKPAAPIDEIPVEEWLDAVNVNLTGMFLCARAAFGQMRKQDPQGGRIINNGSVAAYVPRPGSVSYTATKHGVTGITRSLSLDGRDFNIACGQIDIGNARSDMLDTLAKELEAKGETPPPMIDVKFVAEAVLNMANLPLNANVQFQTLMATQMPYIGRG